MTAIEVTAPPALPFASMFAKPEEVGPPKSIMIYGKPGRRKTTIASEIIKVPGFDKVLIVDIDNGTEVLVNDPEIYATIGDDFGAPGEKRINIIPLDKLDPEVYAKLNYLFGYPDGRGGWVKGEAFKAGYDAIILDTLDVAQESAVASLLNSTFNDKGQLDTRAAWGKVNEWTTGLMWVFQNDPGVVGIVVMHSKEDAEETGQVTIKPKLQGGAKDNIAGIPSLVVYVDFKTNPQKETKLVATLGDDSVTTTKNRYRLPGHNEDFTLPKLYDLINQKQNPAAASAAA